MRWSATGKVLFFFYCLEFGIFLVVAPWSPSWDRAIMHLPFGWLRELYLDPWTRGALSGLGFVHLLLAAYDLNRFLAIRFGPTTPSAVPHPFLTRLLHGDDRRTGKGADAEGTQG